MNATWMFWTSIAIGVFFAVYARRGEHLPIYTSCLIGLAITVVVMLAWLFALVE